MRPRSRTLTPQELAIMQVVWVAGAATVREVHDALSQQRKLAYTTVLTMMNVLERKGHLRKRAEGRSFVYQPTRPRARVVKALVQDFLDRVFGGSAEPLLVHLVDERRLTREQIRRLAERVGRKDE